ncbi:hypothetical protein V8G54_004102 [Vigna mungo]|uniref:Reverse transcriptase/retrotransposon-derived protein RNase H-like domain-containing protein n=1 Tax=Vigna mungo TaxID=3915 RepID=A0AAQ3PC23_VIGMU
MAFTKKGKDVGRINNSVGRNQGSQQNRGSTFRWLTDEEIRRGRQILRLRRKMVQQCSYLCLPLAGMTTKKSWKTAGLPIIFSPKILLERCGLTYVDTPKYMEEVGDGRKLKFQGKCSDLVLEIQGLKIRQEFFIFESLCGVGVRAVGEFGGDTIGGTAGVPPLSGSIVKFLQGGFSKFKRATSKRLKAGIIHPSISSYSSPIILVRKDGGALNKMTIPNKFPIPMIEELLDELAGATIFSKLDLKFVLQLLKDRQMKVNKNKCIFCQSNNEYVGHVISDAGVSADPKKVEAMRNWPTPRDSTTLSGFLGLTRYYKRFVQDYGKIAKPLTQLLKKDGFWWNEKAKKAFEILKVVVSYLPTLAIPDFSKPFVVEAYGSSKGLGAVLLQEESGFVDHAQNKSVYERKLMIVVQAEEVRRKDMKLSGLMADLLVDPNAHTHYEIRKGRLYYHGKLVLSKSSSRIPVIIKELHESPVGWT